MPCSDARGLTAYTSSAEALSAYEKGVNLALRWRSGAMEALQAAVATDPQFVMAHCARAYIGFRMGLWDAAFDGHRQAVALADSAHDTREHLHIQAVDAMQGCNRAVAQEHLGQIATQYPTDRLALWALNMVHIAQGKYREGLSLARRSLEMCPDDPMFLTMTGFFLEQSGHNEEGLVLSRRSMVNDPTNLYTYHAVGHCYQARGDYREALSTFARAASLERYPHILWHLAEMNAILGYERITHDYWASTSPALPLFERIELMWRLEVLRHATVEDATWQELAMQSEQLLQHGDYLTIWMHHWIGLALARAGREAQAQQQLALLEQLPEGGASGHWSTLGADLLRGEMVLMRGDYAGAAQLMAPAVQRMGEIGGGSREQKDIFLDVYVEVQRRLGNIDQVMALAQRRLLSNPNHLLSLNALAWAYKQSGQVQLQQQACRQLLRCAEAVCANVEAAEFQEARQTIQAAA